MREVGRPPGMKDVANLAGVFHQTVSRVLNDHPSVRSETRDRVIAAMRELDYQLNSAARTLVTNRSHTLRLVTFDNMLIGPEAQERISGWQGTLHDAGLADNRTLRTFTTHVP